MISDASRETANLLKILGLTILTAVACSAAPETTTAETADRPMATSIAAATASGEEVQIADDPEVILDRYEAALPLFEYDPAAPLEIEVSDPVGSGEVRSQELSFASPKGGRVEATVVIPQGEGPFPALIIVDADNRRDELSLAEAYAASFGVLSIMIDPPPARSQDADRAGLEVFTFTERDLEEQIQFVVDLRRVIDLLQSREDVDPDRIGLRAFGVGAETAALLSGVEDRIMAYNLINLVGGPVTFYGGPGRSDAPFLALGPEEQQRWLAAMEPIEPVYFVGHASPAHLLFQLEGELLRVNAQLLLEVASEPKEVDWVEPGTGLQADCRAAIWFSGPFDLAERQLYPECEG